MPDGSLGIAAGGDLATARPDGRPGVLPLLSGDKAFYVEFQAAITDHHPDHWPALWLLPIEHNMRQEDHLPGDPPKFERWMEIDVDEGGFGPGHHGALINWSGIWPDYKMRQNQHNMTSRQPLDRTQAHVFGVSYEPDKRQVTWWIDGVAQMSAGGELIPPIARNHHYYLIMSSQTRKEGRPYLMHFYGLRVFTRP
ncbi:hypothetical protein [Zoogloea sp.]|uniref:hypothetical protein n=1 Tax=Zoogloea sp. TaxID=49181 RepID=UPI0035AE8A82